MRRRFVLWLAVLALVGVVAVPVAMAGNGNGAHTASLKGSSENPPNGSKGAGAAIFKFSKDGSELTYKLITANIEGVFAAHIHCAPEGVNGPVGVTLFFGADENPSAILAWDSVTAPDVDNDCNWSSLADVAAAIESGGAYVNVHTSGIPSGELRGQIG